MSTNPSGVAPEGAHCEGVRKIAVLRANALGDFIFALPALAALKAAYPTAELVLLGLPWHAAFLRGRPGPVDRVVVVPPSPGVRGEPGKTEVDEAELERFFAAMAAERFDLALQLHGGGRYSNPFVRRLGARMTAGLKTPDAQPLDRWVPYVYFQHEVLRYLEVAALVGAPPVSLAPCLELMPADHQEAAEVVPASGGPLVVLHPGASDPRRRWPVKRFAAVGDALAGKGARIAVTGTGPEGVLVDELVDAMCAPAMNLCDRLSLGGLAGLLKRATLLVSNDSGPLHVATALGGRTVGLFWCANLINGGPLYRTRHRPLLSWRLECPACGQNCMTGRCQHKASFLDGISVEEVLAEALDLYQ
ncbi:MAG TPA: glycosyltransferase family 9 protein, partial [Trueperaceae bacterium]